MVFGIPLKDCILLVADQLFVLVVAHYKLVFAFVFFNHQICMWHEWDERPCCCWWLKSSKFQNCCLNKAVVRTWSLELTSVGDLARKHV